MREETSRRYVDVISPLLSDPQSTSICEKHHFHKTPWFAEICEMKPYLRDKAVKDRFREMMRKTRGFTDYDEFFL